MKHVKRIVCLLSLSIALQAAKTVILIPFDESDTSDRFFAGGYDNYWFQLKQACEEAGYHLTTRRDVDPRTVLAIVAFNAPRLQMLSYYPQAKKILYTWEPPTIQPLNFSEQIHSKFDYVATWHDGFVDGKKYHKFNYGLQFAPAHFSLMFHDKKLCCMFAGNKRSDHPYELYSQRRSLIDYFERTAHQDFDLYGPDWDIPLKTYRGYVHDKIAIMEQYRFVFVYENMRNIPGYITEKIFDAFSAGCVPIYWGASNIAEYIPRECFIAREDFDSDADVYRFLKTMPERTYEKYVTAIRNFLLSDKAALFSREQYIKTFIALLQTCEK